VKHLVRALPLARKLFKKSDLARVGRSYLQVLAGTTGRLILQATYFLVLANTLSLPEMGSFASASAIGIMIGSFTAFGFSAMAFQAAASRHNLLGAYFGIFLVGSFLTLPIGLLIATPLYLAILSGSMAVSTFLLIVIAEILLFRLIEGLQKVHNGLGNYGRASLVGVTLTTSRAAGSIVFAAAGGATVETWAPIYFVVSAFAAGIGFAFFWPRTQVRWRTKLFIARLKDALLFAFSSLTFDSHTEVDKIVLMVAAGDRAAGIYAISVRIFELAVVPVRAFYVLYSRKLMRERRMNNVVVRNLIIEAGVFTVTLLSYAIFIALLGLKPSLLGTNVEVARELFAVAVLVPAFRAMMELHSELYFAYRELGLQAVATLGLVVLKAVLIAGAVGIASEPMALGFSLNWIFAAIYLISAGTVYRAIAQSERIKSARRPA
jgi:O-antigen/teichoic acid export membrane protein